MDERTRESGMPNEGDAAFDSCLSGEGAATIEPDLSGEGDAAIEADRTAPDVPERHSVHHSYIWLGTLRLVGIAAMVVAVSAVGGISESLVEEGFSVGEFAIAMAVALGSVVAVFAVVLGYQALSYRHVYYEIGEREFSFYQGILNKRRMHIPYQRVQSVNHTASLVQRLAGVCTLKVETAGGSTNEGATVPYVTVADAERLRHELFARKQALAAGFVIPANVPAASWTVPGGVPDSGQGVVPGAAQGAVSGIVGGNVLDGVDEAFNEVRGAFGGVAYEAGRVTYEHGLSNKELLLTGLTNSTGFSIALIGAIGVGSQLGGVIATVFALDPDAMAEGAASALLQSAPAFVASALAMVLVIVAVVLAFTTLGTCVRFGGFRARRRDSRIEVEQGLLSRQFHGVDVDRVQSLVVRQGFVRRLFGYCELSLARVEAAGAEADSTSQNDALRQGMVIHPFVKIDRVPQIVAGLIPEFSGAPEASIPVARVALRRALVRRCTWAGPGLWLALVVAVGQVAAHAFAGADEAARAFAAGFDAVAIALYIVSAVLVVGSAVSAVLWHRDSNFGLNETFVQVSNGGFSRESILTPRRKVQFGEVKTNPFQRAAGVGTLRLRTAAGVGTTVTLLDVSEADARRWLEWLQPGGSLRAHEIADSPGL